MLVFSTAEKYIFLVVVIAAMGIFIFMANKPFAIIRRGKPDPDRLQNIGRRIARLFKEVLFQKRVLGGRPVVGILHASVFLAFLLFAFETVNMALEPYGYDYLPGLLGSALPIFRTIVQVLALICAFSMIGLSYRRFFMRKISPDPTSYESGIVALMIILLMLTYIDIYSTNIIAAKVDWWLHMLIILGFPILILNSKHRHIFLAPVAIFLRKSRLWEVSKMNLDFESAESEEDIQLGLETIADIPWKLRLDFFSCVECRRCTDNCPASQAGQELRPAEFIIAGRQALLNMKPEKPVLGATISEKAIGQCTSCMACENACPVGIEHSQLLSGVKAAQTLSLGTGVATEFHKTMQNYSNPFSASPDVRTDLIGELRIPLYEKGRTEYLLWLGCIWAYNPDYKSVVKSTVTLLNSAGVSYGVLKKEMCSGHHSRKQGEEMQFQMLAEENAAHITENEVKKIVTGCPHCMNTLTYDYIEFLGGRKINVYHHTQLFSELLGNGSLKLKQPADKDAVLTYHDPCYLGRYEHIFREPRDIIRSAGIRLIETPQNKQYSYCCGGGAAGFTIEAKEEKRVDQYRKEQIKSTGAATLITGCPECKMMLSGAVPETKDISELLFDALDNRL
ncbi:(Fe-S)-binding protein [candidate division KSB1 bacterium]